MGLNKKQKLWLPVICLLAFGVALYSYSRHFQTLTQTQIANKIEDQLPSIPENLAAVPKPPKGKTITLPILMYHHVGQYPANANSTRKDMTVSAEDFENQTKWLKEQGYNGITLNNLYSYSLGQFAMPSKPVIFTFDDGYQDVFENAVPVLKKYGYSGSFAIITQWPGQTQGDNVYASWQTIAEAQKEGMEIVCHTQNHFDGTNPKFTTNYILKNLNGCVNDIYNHLGIKTQILIYPYGHYTADYLAQAKQAGFVMGVTVHEGDVINLSNLMQTPRVRVHGAETLLRFKDILLHKVSFANSSTSTSTLLQIK